MNSPRFTSSMCGIAAIAFLYSAGCSSDATDTEGPAGVIRSTRVGDCAVILAALGSATSNVQCTVSADLTTANPDTTPADNSIAGLPAGAFAPRGDRAAIAAGAAFRTPITMTVPGLQITGTMADDVNAHWLLRLPNAWNGRLVMGVPASTRSEYAGDWVHSDYLVQQGYAYVSTNKGMLNSRPGSLDDPKSCHLSPPGVATSSQMVRFYLSDSIDGVSKWFTRTIESTAIGKALVNANYGSAPAYTYVVGLSAGGWVVRRLLEVAPDAFDGGLDWESPAVNAGPDNGILAEFPVGLANFPDYMASGYSTSSNGFKAMQAFGYPPDVFAANSNPFSTRGSYLETFYNNFWNLLECGFVGGLDPSYSLFPPPVETYGSYDYTTRRQVDNLSGRMDDIGFKGNLRRPLISIHGTLDALALISSARDYHQSVVQNGAGHLHRLYEIQNGSHLDRNPDPPWNFTQIERISPHFAPAFSRLVSWIEAGTSPPAGQCVPRGGTIIDDPTRIGRRTFCINLLE
jgi:pimeloyl-ACP methyl ester carboxylesterase